MWVETGAGRTEGSLEFYIEAEPRLKVARQKLDAGEITPWKAKQVVNKIFGNGRLMKIDWADAVEGRKAPKGFNQVNWERGLVEKWLEPKPLSYRRVYHSPATVIQFLLSKEELEIAEKGKPDGKK